MSGLAITQVFVLFFIYLLCIDLLENENFMEQFRKYLKFYADVKVLAINRSFFAIHAKFFLKAFFCKM